MQNGLNIGIGSWIDARQSASALPAFPTTAIPFELRHFGDLSTPADLARAVELSLLANRVDNGGTVYESNAIPAYLWERHRQTVGTMESALSTLSTAEREALARADAVLFGLDGFSISERYTIYMETRRIHEDMVLQGASPSEVNGAYQDWVVLGHKVEVEAALATKVTLGRGTSRLKAADDVSRIELALGSLGGEVPIAPTLFTPISAVSTEHWTEAEVDLQALEDAIRPQVSLTAWRQFRQNKNGKVRFRFATIELMRAWFSVSIYEADDWRLPAGSQTVVADGLGHEGQLPAYFSRLYMAQILEIRNEPVRPTPPIDRPPIILPPIVRPRIERPPIIRPQIGGLPGTLHDLRISQKSIALRPTPVRAMRGPTALAAESAANAGASSDTRVRGVTRRNVTVGTTASRRPATAVIAQQGISRLDLVPHQLIGVTGRISKIEKINAITASNRLSYAQILIATTANQPSPPQDNTTYLVGFGRTNLPACPNPNPNYQWP